MDTQVIEQNSGMSLKQWKDQPQLIELDQYTLNHPCGAKTAYRTVKQKVNNGTYATRLQFWGCQGRWRYSFEKNWEAFIKNHLKTA